MTTLPSSSWRTSKLRSASELAIAFDSHPALQDRLDKKNLDELDELEDELGEDTLEFYRARRLAELKAKQASDRFGNFQMIGQADYKREVSEAKDVFVVLLLFMFSHPDSQLLAHALAQLSSKHRAVKFVRIVAQDAIPNFPEKNVPTILIYKDVRSLSDMFITELTVSPISG